MNMRYYDSAVSLGSEVQGGDQDRINLMKIPQ